MFFLLLIEAGLMYLTMYLTAELRRRRLSLVHLLVSLE